MPAGLGDLVGLQDPVCAEPRSRAPAWAPAFPAGPPPHPQQLCLPTVPATPVLGSLLSDSGGSGRHCSVPPMSLLPPPSAQNLTEGGRHLPAPLREGHLREKSRTTPRGFPGSSRGRPAPWPWARSLPPARKADAKEGAPAITSDHEAAVSMEALAEDGTAARQGARAPTRPWGYRIAPQTLA